MDNKDFEFFRKQLKGYGISCIVTEIISVSADEGVYNIIKDIISNTYLVEYIPNHGYTDVSFHFTLSGVIEYIKEGDVHRE